MPADNRYQRYLEEWRLQVVLDLTPENPDLSAGERYDRLLKDMSPDMTDEERAGLVHRALARRGRRG